MPISTRGTPTYTTSTDMSAATAIGPAPASGEFSRLLEVEISVGTAMEVSLQQETNAAVKYSFLMAANSTIQFAFPNPVTLTVADKRWMGKASVSGQVRITTTTESVP